MNTNFHNAVYEFFEFHAHNIIYRKVLSGLSTYLSQVLEVCLLSSDLKDGLAKNKQQKSSPEQDIASSSRSWLADNF